MDNNEDHIAAQAVNQRTRYERLVNNLPHHPMKTSSITGPAQREGLGGL